MRANVFAASLAVATVVPRVRGAVFAPNWQPVGLQEVRLNTVALSPGWPADQTIVVGSAFTGVFYRSRDGGLNWQTSQFPGLPTQTNIAPIAVSPKFQTDQMLFVGGSAPITVNRSTDGGASFSRVAGIPTTPVWGLAISPTFAEDGMVFAATNSGLYKSSDGGTSFTLSNSGIPSTNLFKVAISPAFASDRTLFVGMTGTGVGVYKSTNGGASWNPSGASLPVTPTFNGPLVEHIGVSPAYSSDKTVYAAIRSAGLFRSEDGGDTWEKIIPYPEQSLGTFAISPNFETDHVLLSLSARGLEISNDTGDSWTQASSSSGLPANLEYGGGGSPFVFSPAFANDQSVFVATSNGVWSAVIPEPASATFLALISCTLLRRRGRNHTRIA